MTWPTTTISTTNVSTSTANPSLARVDINEAFIALNQIISGKNAVDGAVVLDNNGKIGVDMIPNNVNITGSLALLPTSTIVQVWNTLRLNAQTTAQIQASTATYFVGDMMMCTDAVGGTDPGLCIYDGTDWRVLDLSTLSTL
jgi:hypothetical protein